MSDNIYTCSDRATAHDELGFTAYVKPLLRVIQGTPIKDTPLTIGVFGSWGSGKTSLLRMIEAELNPQAAIPVWFDAWRFTHTDALWRAMLISVVESIRFYIVSQDDVLTFHLERLELIERGDTARKITATMIERERERVEQALDDLVTSLYRSFERDELGGIQVDWGEAGRVAARTAVRLSLAAIPIVGPVTQAVERAVTSAQEEIGKGEDASDIFQIFQREKARVYRDRVVSLEQFYQRLKDLIDTWIIPNGRRLVIFIDDLDRCLPEEAISVLEATKVFLDLQGCIFVLGADREVIEKGIRVRYNNLLASAQIEPQHLVERNYLEKIVQLPFELPTLTKYWTEQFLRGRLPIALSQTNIEPVLRVLLAGLTPNPRKIKRAINCMHLVVQMIAEEPKAANSTSLALLAKVIVIQNSYAEIYERVAHDANSLRHLEQQARSFNSANEKTSYSLLESHPRLREMLCLPPFFDISDEEIHNLLSLTSTIARPAISKLI